MKRALVVSMIAAFGAATLCYGIAFAKKATKVPPTFELTPASDSALPPDLAGKTGGMQRGIAAADTFVLHTENFDDGTMAPYTAVDFTAQLGTFFHVADATELDGGISGGLSPLAGAKSMWCGVVASTAAPFCGWADLPGYGNDWVQMLESQSFTGDSVVVSYKVFWDSEPGYDFTRVEWSNNGGASWTELPVTDTYSTTPGLYDGTGPTPFLAETVGDRQTGGNNTTRVRFRFNSDGAWSDEDGLWPTDGAVIVDDVALTVRLGSALIATNTQDFESATVGSTTAGIWTGAVGPAFGSYAALYPGASLLQEDPCFFNTSVVLAFFVDPSIANYACHAPDPRPDVGVVPYGTADEVYMNNEVLSPVFANAGFGNEYRLEFLTYRDLPLDELIFYMWRVRSWDDGCPGLWRSDNFFYFGANRDWIRTSFTIGSSVDPSADGFQIAIGAIDLCPFFCGVPENGDCHSHAPLIDEIRVIRVGVTTPQYVVRHTEGLFQDNFAQNGTLTGTSRADMAADILPAASASTILPGDSVSMVIAPVGAAGAGSGPNAYVYVHVRNGADPDPTGAALGSTTVRATPQPTAYGTRWPFVGTTTLNGVTWSRFRMDTTFTALGSKVIDRYCVDLNDNLFTPGDTIYYFYAADADNTPGNGNEGYFTRNVDGRGADVVTTDLSAAAASPMEFTILPAGGNILYVDDQDDRGGPGQLFWDSSFEMLGILDNVDRFDVLAPSSIVDNGPASRVKNNATQIVNVYRTILWDSGNLSSGTVGDGTGLDKSNDWGLLFTFLNTGNLGSGPGLYLSGDDLATDWVGKSGAGAVQVRSAYMNFNLLNQSQVSYGESITPHLTATGASFIHLGIPDEMIAYGGCALINSFDVLGPTGTSVTEYPYPASGDGAIISKQTTNSVGKTATVALSGLSYTFIRSASETPAASSGLDATPPVFPPARVEFLRDLLIKMGHVVGTATGVDPGDRPQYVNALSNNYPNPFNPTTTITYSIKETGHVSLKIYNAAGQVVRTLIDEIQSPKREGFRMEWDGMSDAGNGVASGVYFYRMVTKNFSQTRKMVFLK